MRSFVVLLAVAGMYVLVLGMFFSFVKLLQNVGLPYLACVRVCVCVLGGGGDGGEEGGRNCVRQSSRFPPLICSAREL